MNKAYKIGIAIILSILLTIASKYFFSDIYVGTKDINRFQKVLNKKTSYLDETVNHLLKSGDISSYEALKKNGIILVIYKNDKLYNWTDNSIQFPEYYDSIYYSSKIKFNSNTWYIVKQYLKSSYRVFGFIQIKKEFSYQNRFLENDFMGDFNFLPSEIKINSEKKQGSYFIYDKENKYLFSLEMYEVVKFPFLYKYLTSIFFFLGFFLFLQLVNVLVKQIQDKTQKNRVIGGMVFMFFALRIFQTFMHIPEILYQTELFSPLLFATSDILPSMGDLLLNSIIITFLAALIRRDLYFPLKEDSQEGFRNLLVYTLSYSTIVLYCFYIYHTFRSLILNSSISFETYKITEVSIFSVVGLIIIGLQYSSLILLVYKTSELFRLKIKIEKLMLIFTLIFLGLLFVFFILGYHIDLVSVLFFYLFLVALILAQYFNLNITRYSVLVILILIFSIYSVYFITNTTEIKKNQDMTILVENLATEHDPVAELLLEVMSGKIENDTTLVKMLNDTGLTYQEIINYLRINYFSGYWAKYNFQFFSCKINDSLFFELPEKVIVECHPFFNDLIKNKGMQISNTSFYYIDNINGRVNYLSKISYNHKTDGITLFIELESKLVTTRLGYPELLLDENTNRETYLKEYSYSKYYKGELLSQFGNFHYSLSRDIYGEPEPEFVLFKLENYDHLIYNIDKDNSIIISKPTVSFYDQLISFSYLFVFYYLILLVVLLSLNLSKIDHSLTLNFKNKIQFSIISIILLSLLLVGGSTIYFSIEQYKNKNRDSISEKIQSVYTELDHKLALENELNFGWSSSGYANLDQLLIKFADVFYSDINLYSTNGQLLATSRPEVFNQGLTSTIMNPVAYNNLFREKKAEFIHRENIGKLDFFSAYLPFFNSDNKLLAYINLPYFTKQNEFREEITALSVAVVNIYVFLILLTVTAAIFISETITKPLRILQEKFGKIKLLNDHELIQYRGSDEIAALVGEYNRMVQELQKSAELLARSERESAWREMARQVAHEIKNPLTPMKLNIQHLQRAWNDNRDDYENIQKKVTQTLIEQVDNLSKIASEFSNFAQMPKTKNEIFNLTQKIRDTVNLFSDTSPAEFAFLSKSDKDIYINADKEQISRVLINLFTNAIQSIPDDRIGKIRIEIEKPGKTVILKVIDNGKGIPDVLKKKMFTPNFTTKSSGMGLGLAITKNIVENSKGNIRFETKFGEGTTFIIELPGE